MGRSAKRRPGNSECPELVADLLAAAQEPTPAEVEDESDDDPRYRVASRLVYNIFGKPLPPPSPSPSQLVVLQSGSFAGEEIRLMRLMIEKRLAQQPAVADPEKISLPPVAAPEEGLSVIPGGITCRGLTVDLSGKPWLCLNELLKTRFLRIDWQTLRELVWKDDDDSVEPVTKDAVKNQMKIARAALRKLARLAGKKVKDPLLSVNHGDQAAWKLVF